MCRVVESLKRLFLSRLQYKNSVHLFECALRWYEYREVLMCSTVVSSILGRLCMTYENTCEYTMRCSFVFSYM